MTKDDLFRISRKSAKWFLCVLATAACALLAAYYLQGHFTPKPDAEPEPTVFLGVPDDSMRVYEAVAAEYPESFRSVAPGIEQQDNSRKNVRLYEACPSLNPGPQLAGSCVGWGQSTARYAAACVKAKTSGVPVPLSQFFPSYDYAISRVQIGNNKPPCSSDGAYPSYAIRGAKQFGFVTYDEVAARGYQYSGSLDRNWGCKGPPREIVDLGKSRAGGDAYPIRSIEEWRDAECNGYPVTVAIPWKPGRTYRSEDGKWCMAFDGRNLGGHQICSLAYDGSDGKPEWLLMNSHGANWPRGVKHEDGTPAGAVWVDERWARWIVDNGELWAISDVPGFEAEELDLSIFR